MWKLHWNNSSHEYNCIVYHMQLQLYLSQNDRNVHRKLNLMIFLKPPLAIYHWLNHWSSLGITQFQRFC